MDLIKGQMNGDAVRQHSDQKAIKFIELANKRVIKVIKDLQKEIDDVKERFKYSSGGFTEEFTL